MGPGLFPSVGEEVSCQISRGEIVRVFQRRLMWSGPQEVMSVGPSTILIGTSDSREAKPQSATVKEKPSGPTYVAEFGA